MPAAKKAPAAKAAEKVHDKRKDFDNPPVDTPVPVVDAVGEVQAADEKHELVIAVEGSTVRVSIGKASVVLDGEGIRGAKRHFDKASASV